MKFSSYDVEKFQGTHDDDGERLIRIPKGLMKTSTIYLPMSFLLRAEEYNKRRAESRFYMSSRHTFACMVTPWFTQQLQRAIDKEQFAAHWRREKLVARVGVASRLFAAKNMPHELERVVFEFLGWWGRVPQFEPIFERFDLQPCKKQLNIDMLRKLLNYGCDDCIEECKRRQNWPTRKLWQSALLKNLYPLRKLKKK
jgi:hypothetical protein